MEAPEKIYRTTTYLDSDRGKTVWKNKPVPGADNIEYIRTDAFVEKACKAFCKVCKMPNCNSKDCSYLKDIRNHMKGE